MKSVASRLGEYIEQETVHHSFYKVMAGCTDNTLTMQIFLDLSEQALQHVAVLKGLYRSLCAKDYLAKQEMNLSFSQNFSASVKRHTVLLIQTAKDYAKEGLSSRDSRVREAFLKLWAQEISVVQRMLLILLPD